ncbi:hypothetical protein FHS21_003618 [Phyllobacterium trifolii]|uniref:Uncharacterized protein n=1 Tax=Phyllobacterium trifolii TaxID=300193 RepID=A0A839UEA5_9HYPH|nr:hypothetical protein [Phyllobacterium trifolii]MBB3147202.1 hypothetical protein [Phyllobacterium trifolii]
MSRKKSGENANPCGTVDIAPPEESELDHQRQISLKLPSGKKPNSPPPLSGADPSVTAVPARAAHTRSENLSKAETTSSATLPHGVVGIETRFPSLAKHQSYREEFIRARLVAELNQCIERGRVPRSRRSPTKISRKNFADILGVSESAITLEREILTDYEAILFIVEPLETVPNLRFGANPHLKGPLDKAGNDVIALYPELSKHQHYPSKSNAATIVDVLNRQITAGWIKRSRGGNISRKVLAERTGVHKGAMVPYLTIIKDYEKAIGGKESVHEKKIPAMRLWLDEALADGSLEIRDGKISRGQLFQQFDFPKNSLALLRYPRVAELVNEYDQLVRDTFYQHSAVAANLNKLKALLRNPPVGKDGRTINRKAIERALNLPLGTAARSPYIEMIIAAENALQKQRELDPLICTIGGQIFKFIVFTEQGWPFKLVLRMKASFERAFRTKGKPSAKKHFASLLKLFAFLASGSSTACRSLRDGLNAYVSPKTLMREWTIVTQEYRDHLAAHYKNVLSRNSNVSSTNAVIKHLSNDGVVPVLSLPLIKFRKDHKHHLRSIAELTPSSSRKRSESHVDDYLHFATSMLEQAAKLYEVEIASEDQSDFSRVLRLELQTEQFTAGEDPARVIIRILDRRLKAIETAAARIVASARRTLEVGRSLLGRGRDPGADWEKLLRSTSINKHDRLALMRQHFPSGSTHPDQGIANLLAVVAQRYGYLYPTYRVSHSDVGQFFSKRALEYGGVRLLQSYLTPSSEAVSATLTLYLLASGSNISVGRGLYHDCLETSEEPHHSKVTGYKSRARGKPIFSILEDRGQAIVGMKWLKQAFEKVRRIIKGPQASQLFICNGGKGDGFKLLEEWTYRSEFKRLIASIPELSELRITPNMLRPSILLKAALETDGRTRLSIAIGQHTENVNQEYTNKLPYQFLHDVNIRHFMHSLETAVIRNVKEAHELLGVSPAGFERRIEAVMKTGLGTICANRMGRPGNEGSLCKSVDCWNDCPQLIVIARKEDIAILQIWQHSLRAVEGDWIRDHPERWAAVWLPWLCFVDAIEVKMRSSHRQVWRAASELAALTMATPGFQPMRLF